MKRLFVAIVFIALCSFTGPGDPPEVGISFKSFWANRTAITGYTKINARYEWTAGAFDSGLHVPQYNGVPSGLRSGVWTADGAVAVDTSNHRLYFYSGGSWRYSTSGTGGSYTFTNGLTESGGTVKLGGTLTDGITTIQRETTSSSDQLSMYLYNATKLSGLQITSPLNLLYSKSITGSRITGLITKDTVANYSLPGTSPPSFKGNSSTIFSRISGDNYKYISLDSNIVRINTDTVKIENGINYTLSTTGKKIMLRDTATGLVQNIDASLIGGGGVTFVSNPAIDTLNKSLNIAVWGNSLTEQTPGQPLQLSLLTNRSVYNGGVGGYTSTQIIARFIADTGRYRNSVIFEVGRNNYNSRAIIKADLATAVAALAAVGNDRYLVLSVTNGGGEGIGTAIYDSIIAINNDLAAIYGSHYYDVRSALVARYNPAIGADVANHAQDIPPLSLRQDSVHFNWNGYKVWADSVYYNKWSSVLNYTRYSDSAISANQAVSLFKGRFQNIDVRPGGTYSIGSKTIAYVPNDSTHSPQDYGLLSYYYGNGGLLSTGNAIENYSAGFNALLNVTSGKKLTFVGKDAGKAVNTAENAVGIGNGALFRLTSGNGGVAVGYQSQYSNETAIGGVSVGEFAGYSNVSTNYLTFVGSNAGFNASGTNVNAFGRKAMFQSSDMEQSGAFGTEALQGVHSAGLTRNYAFGNYALYAVGGSDNIGFGYFSQSFFAQFGSGNSNNSRNVTIGNYSGYKFDNTDNGIYIGHKAGEDTVQGDGNIIIGYDIDVPVKADDNQLSIGNLIYAKGGFGTNKTVGTGNVGIGINNPSTRLHVSGRFTSTQGADVASAAGAIALGTDGNTFEITGTNAITLISNVGWVNGSEINLVFTSTATLTDGTANSGTDIGMELEGNANFTGSADDIVTLVLCEVGGTQRWRMKSKSIN